MKKQSKRKVRMNRVVRGSGNVFLDLGFSKREARELQVEAQRLVRKSRRLTAQNRGDIAEAARRRGEVARPYSKLRKEVGLRKRYGIRLFDASPLQNPTP